MKTRKTIFISEIKNLLKQYPDVEWILWSQGTPSYADGDTPTFFSSLKEGEFEFKAFGQELEPWSWAEALPLPQRKTVEKFLGQLLKLTKSISEDELKLWFGDAVEITVEKTKIKIKDDLDSF
jgi:hypothetical protein